MARISKPALARRGVAMRTVSAAALARASAHRALADVVTLALGMMVEGAAL